MIAISAERIDRERHHPLKSACFWLLAKCMFVFRRPLRLKATDNFLNLGCGFSYYPDWCNADLPRLHDVILRGAKSPDWILDATRRWDCPDNTWDGIFTEHVLEHLTYSQCIALLREAHRTLKPGSWIRLVIPDLQIYVRNYLEKGALLPWLGHPAMAISSLTQSFGHISVWDSELLSVALRETGFSVIQVQSFGKSFDPRIALDAEARSSDSMYVEALK